MTIGEALEPLTITTEAEIQLGLFEPVELRLEAAGGLQPYQWTVLDGQFPEGVVMNDSGALSGEPSEEGTFLLRVRVTDAAGQTAEQNFRVSIVG
jgi:Putative Ig domain